MACFLLLGTRTEVCLAACMSACMRRRPSGCVDPTAVARRPLAAPSGPRWPAAARGGHLVVTQLLNSARTRTTLNLRLLCILSPTGLISDCCVLSATDLISDCCVLSATGLITQCTEHVDIQSATRHSCVSVRELSFNRRRKLIGDQENVLILLPATMCCMPVAVLVTR